MFTPTKKPAITEIAETIAMIVTPVEWGIRVKAVFRGDEPQNALLEVRDGDGQVLDPPVPMVKTGPFKWEADVAVKRSRWTIKVTPVQGHGRSLEATIEL